MNEIFTVDNVKCAGCVKTIQDGLGELPGVTAVTVDIPSGEVRVEGTDLDRARLAARLSELGYPERA